VTKGGRQKKESLVQNVGEALESYNSVYAFGFDNLRASTLKDLRMLHRDDRCVWKACHACVCTFTGSGVDRTIRAEY
jgi:ribosomal protein L10